MLVSKFLTRCRKHVDNLVCLISPRELAGYAADIDDHDDADDDGDQAWNGEEVEVL